MGAHSHTTNAVQKGNPNSIPSTWSSNNMRSCQTAAVWRQPLFCSKGTKTCLAMLKSGQGQWLVLKLMVFASAKHTCMMLKCCLCVFIFILFFSVSVCLQICSAFGEELTFGVHSTSIYVCSRSTVWTYLPYSDLLIWLTLSNGLLKHPLM